MQSMREILSTSLEEIVWSEIGFRRFRDQVVGMRALVDGKSVGCFTHGVGVGPWWHCAMARLLVLSDESC